jgi:hypothetical protein
VPIWRRGELWLRALGRRASRHLARAGEFGGGGSPLNKQATTAAACAYLSVPLRPTPAGPGLPAAALALAPGRHTHLRRLRLTFAAAEAVLAIARRARGRQLWYLENSQLKPM